MLLQPLVENAVKHGIEPAVEGGMISISCKQLENKVLITIANTGQPFKGGSRRPVYRKRGWSCKYGKATGSDITVKN